MPIPTIDLSPLLSILLVVLVALGVALFVAGQALRSSFLVRRRRRSGGVLAEIPEDPRP